MLVVGYKESFGKRLTRGIEEVEMQLPNPPSRPRPALTTSTTSAERARSQQYPSLRRGARDADDTIFSINWGLEVGGRGYITAADFVAISGGWRQVWRIDR